MSKRVFIGVGHGGSDPGAVGKVREADANLVIALKLRDELSRHGLLVGMSRMTNEFDPLREEIVEANAFGADICIDIHNNAGGGNGFEVYRQTNAYSLQSEHLATSIENRVKEIGQESRGIRTKLNKAGTDYFGFLRQIKAPAVIVEGFFVDSDDALGFDSIPEQQSLGIAYAKGILDFLGIRWKPPATDEAAMFFDAVATIYDAGIINSPAYWQDQDAYSTENVRLLIRKVADYIDQQEDRAK